MLTRPYDIRSARWRLALVAGCRSPTSLSLVVSTSVFPWAFPVLWALESARGLGPALLGAGAVGMLGAAAFRTDPVSGYPPGTPDRPARGNTLGVLHDLFSVPIFLCIPAAGLAFGRAFLRVGERGWAAYSAASGLGMLAAFALASLGFSQQQGPAAMHFAEIGGALQRASIAIGVAWLTSLAARALVDTAAGAG